MASLFCMQILNLPVFKVAMNFLESRCMEGRGEKDPLLSNFYVLLMFFSGGLSAVKQMGCFFLRWWEGCHGAPYTKPFWRPTLKSLFWVAKTFRCCLRKKYGWNLVPVNSAPYLYLLFANERRSSLMNVLKLRDAEGRWDFLSKRYHV